MPHDPNQPNPNAPPKILPRWVGDAILGGSDALAGLIGIDTGSPSSAVGQLGALAMPFASSFKGIRGMLGAGRAAREAPEALQGLKKAIPSPPQVTEVSGIDWGGTGGSMLDPMGLGLSKAGIPDFNPNMPNLARQMGPKAPYSTVTRQPKPGGVLHDVLERAGMKGVMGDSMTPGESRLMKHYSGLIR